MEGIRDYSRTEKFWDMIKGAADDAKKTFEGFWQMSEVTRLTPHEAQECLNSLYLYSHARIADIIGERVKYFYPTAKCNTNRLKSKTHLWWVDHFTGGISHKGTLSWFGTSSTGRASTHFVMGYHGDPFYIIPLTHGAWHAPARNADSWSIEMVNCGPVVLKDDKWYRLIGAGKEQKLQALPQALVDELPPQAVTPAYKGASYYQPFTADQITANIKLKRVIRWATQDRYLSPERMSQHSQWQDGKRDMGPLWPFDEVNQTAFIDFPLDDIASYHQALDAALVLAPDEPKTLVHPDWDDPGQDLEDDLEKENKSNTVGTVQELQKTLNHHGYTLAIDGNFGAETRQAVVRFQRSWNDTHPDDLLTVDGIPGPQTLRRLKNNG